MDRITTLTEMLQEQLNKIMDDVSEEENKDVKTIALNYVQAELIVTLFNRTGLTWFDRMNFVTQLAEDVEDKSGLKNFMNTFMCMTTKGQKRILEEIFLKYNTFVTERDGHPE